MLVDLCIEGSSERLSEFIRFERTDVIIRYCQYALQQASLAIKSPRAVNRSFGRNEIQPASERRLSFAVLLKRPRHFSDG